MNSDSTHPNTLPHLLRDLRDETTTLLRQEVALAKAELRENSARVTAHAVQIAIGGFVAYAGAIVFLIGLGLLVSWLLARLGMPRDIALWVSLGAVGAIVAAIGATMLVRAKNALTHDDVAPRRTLETLREDKNWVQNKLQHSQ